MIFHLNTCCCFMYGDRNLTCFVKSYSKQYKELYYSTVYCEIFKCMHIINFNYKSLKSASTRLWIGNFTFWGFPFWEIIYIYNVYVKSKDVKNDKIFWFTLWNDTTSWKTFNVIYFITEDRLLNFNYITKTW